MTRDKLAAIYPAFIQRFCSADPNELSGYCPYQMFGLMNRWNTQVFNTPV